MEINKYSTGEIAVRQDPHKQTVPIKDELTIKIKGTGGKLTLQQNQNNPQFIPQEVEITTKESFK